MSLADFPALNKLPNSEKLKLADQLWQAGVGDSMPVPAEQMNLLDSRWKAYPAGKLRRISLEEMERRLDER